MQNPAKAFLPSQIMDLWQLALGELPEWFREVLLDFAPPLSEQAIHLMRQWSGDNRLDEILQMMAGKAIPEILPTGILTKYPLFGAHEDLSKLSSNGSIHGLLSEVLRLPESQGESELISLDIYYQDCLSFRKAVRRTLAASPKSTNFEDAIIHVLQHDELLSPEVRTRCLRLIDGERLPGVADFHRTATTYIDTHLQRIPSRRVLCVNTLAFFPLQEDTNSEDESFLEPLKSFHPILKPRNNNNKSSEPDDPDSEASYRRKVPDLRTRTDDKRIMSGLPWLMAVRDCRSEIDLHRLPQFHVTESIHALHKRGKPLEWAFVWILVTTGLSVKRLSDLEVVNDATQKITDASSVRLQPDLGILEIHLIDGPSGSEGACHRVVVLPLPVSIVNAIITSGSAHPFAQTAGYADHTLRRHFKNVPGLVPTCRRIRATAEAIIVGLAQDTFAALTLKGEYGHSSRGAAAYRTVSDSELHELHLRAIHHLRQCHPVCAQTGDLICPAPTVPISRACDRVGSAKAVQPRVYRPLFQELSTQIEFLIEQSHQDKGRTGVHADALLELNHAHAQLAYMAFLLSTGARPVVERAYIKLIGNRWYIQDKDSIHFSERRAVPAIPTIVEQLRDQRLLTHHLTQARQFAHLKIKETFKHRGDLPLWMEVSNHHLRVRPIKQSDMEALWTRFNLQPRATRHTFADTLRPLLPEMELHALLGHSGGGWQRESLMSMATESVSPMTRQAIQTLLDEAGFHMIKVLGRHVV